MNICEQCSLILAAMKIVLNRETNGAVPYNLQHLNKASNESSSFK